MDTFEIISSIIFPLINIFLAIEKRFSEKKKEKEVVQNRGIVQKNKSGSNQIFIYNDKRRYDNSKNENKQSVKYKNNIYLDSLIEKYSSLFVLIIVLSSFIYSIYLFIATPNEIKGLKFFSDMGIIAVFNSFKLLILFSSMLLISIVIKNLLTKSGEKIYNVLLLFISTINFISLNIINSIHDIQIFYNMKSLKLGDISSLELPLNFIVLIFGWISLEVCCICLLKMAFKPAQTRPHSKLWEYKWKRVLAYIGLLIIPMLIACIAKSS